MIYLDTHVVAWLYAGRADLIPPRARSLIDANDLLISPMVALELAYLFETGRTAEPARSVVQWLERSLGARRCDLAFADVVDGAVHENWTRDPFDRFVVSHARIREAPLLTKDRAIHTHYEGAVWEAGG